MSKLLKRQRTNYVAENKSLKYSEMNGGNWHVICNFNYKAQLREKTLQIAGAMNVEDEF